MMNPVAALTALLPDAAAHGSEGGAGAGDALEDLFLGVFLADSDDAPRRPDGTVAESSGLTAPPDRQSDADIAAGDAAFALPPMVPAAAFQHRETVPAGGRETAAPGPVPDGAEPPAGQIAGRADLGGLPEALRHAFDPWPQADGAARSYPRHTDGNAARSVRPERDETGVRAFGPASPEDRRAPVPAVEGPPAWPLTAAGIPRAVSPGIGSGVFSGISSGISSRISDSVSPGISPEERSGTTFSPPDGGSGGAKPDTPAPAAPSPDAAARSPVAPGASRPARSLKTGSAAFTQLAEEPARQAEFRVQPAGAASSAAPSGVPAEPDRAALAGQVAGLSRTAARPPDHDAGGAGRTRNAHGEGAGTPGREPPAGSAAPPGNTPIVRATDHRPTATGTAAGTSSPDAANAANRDHPDRREPVPGAAPPLPPAGARERGPAGSAAAGPAPHPATEAAVRVARSVSEQVLASAPAQGETRIEIRLHPAELGRLTVHLAPSDTGLSASFTAERADVADLLRRHGDMFRRDLAQLGFADVSLGFASGGGHRGAPGRTHPDQVPDSAAGIAPPGDSAPETAGARQTAPARAPLHGGELDVRL